MSQKIVQWAKKVIIKLRSLEKWEEKARSLCDHFYELLKNDEYTNFLALFSQVVNDAEALILLPWFANSLLKEAVRLKRARFYPELVRFASPRSTDSWLDDCGQFVGQQASEDRRHCCLNVWVNASIDAA